MNLFAQEAYPAVDYQGRWTVLGLLIVVVVAVWFLAVALATRDRSQPASPPAPVPVPPLDPLGEIAAVEAQVMGGSIESRRAHAELSAIVRRFVSARTGIPADRMHAGELRSNGVPMVPELLAVFYPAQFAASSGGDPVAAIDMARSVVQRWPAAVPT